MPYTHKITITVPASFTAITAAIGRALDPDRGGAESFRPVEGTKNISVTTPCTEAFAAQVPAMLADPALLHGAVSADYATRWKDLVPPTLEECAAFCAAVIPEQMPEPMVVPT